MDTTVPDPMSGLTSEGADAPAPAIGAGLATLAPSLSGTPFRLRSVLPWAVGIAGIFALILAVAHVASLERFATLARSARPQWLALALVVQALTYLVAATVWRQALSSAGHPMGMRTLVPLGIAKLFADQVLPSGGISGTVLVVRGLIRRGVPPASAMAAMMAELLSFDVAYLLVVVASATILRVQGRGNLAIGVGFAIFLVLMIATPIAVLGLRRWGTRRPIAWLSRLLGTTTLLRVLAAAPTGLLRSPVLIVETVGLQVGIFALDAVTLGLVFLALGNAPQPVAIFVSFVIASMVATIGPIPVGLGTFEATSVGMLKLFGVPIETALAATLLLRGLTFWLPIVPGIWLLRSEVRRDDGRTKLHSWPSG